MAETFGGGAAMKVGTVYLVGAGPGDPGLLTLRGLECLQRADLVLYDGLVGPWVLQHTRAQAVRTFRGESRAARALQQREIIDQIIAAARAGQTVVRLKGGDPLVFGRGGEEAAALTEAGIPFEIVPGITAAVAAGAYAGISLTHRQHASAVAFITGHEDPTKPDPVLDYAPLARFPGTLVFYMGLHRLPQITRSLRDCGLDPTTPAAVLCRVTTPAQTTLTGTLATIADLATAAGIAPPSLLVLGECVRDRGPLVWYERRPLFGLSIGIPRAAEQGAELVPQLLELGADPLLMPVLEIAPPPDWQLVDAVLDRLSQYHWLVFTSVNGVDFLLRRLLERGGDLRALGNLRLAAIGDGTAAALARWHLRADVVPQVFRAEALAAALAPRVAGQNVLWARASRGRDVLPQLLSQAGAHLDQLVVYQNRDVAEWPAELHDRLARQPLDWVCLSSPSMARGVARLCPHWTTPHTAPAEAPPAPRFASLSPVTSAAALEVGLPIAVEAPSATWAALFDAVAHAPARPRNSARPRTSAGA
jgi:uroporphyrinogen III methyltransferase/synthase